jgi:DNA-binding response OmpR family regulator
VALRDGSSDSHVDVDRRGGGDHFERLNPGAHDYLPSRSRSRSWSRECIRWPAARRRAAPFGQERFIARQGAAARCRGRQLSLTRKQLGVLEVLPAAKRAVVSAEEMLEVCRTLPHRPSAGPKRQLPS